MNPFNFIQASGAGVGGTLRDITLPDGGVLTADHLRGTVLYTSGQTTNISYQMPPAFPGASLLLIVSQTLPNYLRFVPVGTERFYMDGVQGGLGKYIGELTLTVGDYIQIISFKISEGVYSYLAIPGVGTWVLEV